MSNIFHFEIDADNLQLPGLNSIVANYDPVQKTYELFINRKKLIHWVGQLADEAKLSIENPIETPVILKCNRGLRLVYGTSINELKLKSRKRTLVEHRQISMKFIKENSKLSLSEVGKIFTPEDSKQFDHATVLHAIKTVNNLIDTDKEFKSKYESFIKTAKLK